MLICSEVYVIMHFVTTLEVGCNEVSDVLPWLNSAHQHLGQISCAETQF
jgi:hypothetical protein